MTNVIILGDFNLPLIDWSNNVSSITQQYNSFNECICENALTQHVNFPTRGNNTLDLILTVDPLNVTQVKAVSNFQFLDNISDHVAIVFSVNYLDNTQPTTQQYESHYDYRHADIMSLKYLLSDIKWEELLSDSPTINDMLTTFLDIFFSVCSKCVPTNRRHNGNSVKYPNHIAKLRRKCISLSKGKHLPNGMLKWRAANNDYMLATKKVRRRRPVTIALLVFCQICADCLNVFWQIASIISCIRIV